MRESDQTRRVWKGGSCAVIVAHPDDETLWTGGTILMHPEAKWTIVTLCRKNDKDRAPRFYQVLRELGANGVMGDLDDGPEQTPLNIKEVEEEIVSVLPKNEYDLILTHNTQGEYTRHRRHEEVAEAVINLIEEERLKTKKLWTFAYEDGNRTYLPRPVLHTDQAIFLPTDIWKKKYEIITQIYGFSEDSWEAKTTPRKEAFWTFASAFGIKKWLKESNLLKLKY